MATKKIVGIRRESKSESERRVPLIPRHVASLKDTVDVVIQPAPGQRAIDAAEYEAVGATVSADLDRCDIIIGIKEVPVPEIRPNQVLFFFSHVIKGQPYNMPLLKSLIDNKCTLIDYERIVDDRGARVIAFGKQAGQAGTINGFFALSNRLEALKQPNPFAGLKQAREYGTSSAAKVDLKAVGDRIEREGLPDSLVPFIVVVTGKGNVASGVQDILSALPVVECSPSDVPHKLPQADRAKHIVYTVTLDAGDLYPFKESEGAPTFTFPAFNEHPDRHTSGVPPLFGHCSLFVNAVFWRPEWPKYLSAEYLKGWFEGSPKPHTVVADVTCDIEGSVDCTVKSTLPESPCYVYHPVTRTTTDGYEGEGLVVMAVDILPTEIAVESSEHFGNILATLLPAALESNFQVPFSDLNLPKQLKGAVIVHQGALTPDYKYLEAPLAEHGGA